ncbi:hypothetical protein HBI73_074190 [Parastagonospora nodorum]|nr:hypothetical protein HBI77_025810 [Parastagonospora nodorum]KAH5141599.1 hypothetical protein HBI73_074190 [Parastagonospora nodorum]KAH5234537.1 hypothetical protein HBI62_029440 [Parastagonospora nodorum]KAH5483421.1 hypothetical protein HBI31_179140 [Parastagonospora nodorum]KAH6188436.1 hypothetical protein HBI61_026550 [Parastagonospora nodorum]
MATEGSRPGDEQRMRSWLGDQLADLRRQSQGRPWGLGTTGMVCMADVCQRVGKRGSGAGGDVGAEKRNPHHGCAHACSAFFDQGSSHTHTSATHRAATVHHASFVTLSSKDRARKPLRVPSAEPRKC